MIQIDDYDNEDANKAPMSYIIDVQEGNESDLHDLLQEALTGMNVTIERV